MSEAGFRDTSVFKDRVVYGRTPVNHSPVLLEDLSSKLSLRISWVISSAGVGAGALLRLILGGN